MKHLLIKIILITCLLVAATAFLSNQASKMGNNIGGGLNAGQTARQDRIDSLFNNN